MHARPLVLLAALLAAPAATAADPNFATCETYLSWDVTGRDQYMGTAIYAYLIKNTPGINPNTAGLLIAFVSKFRQALDQRCVSPGGLASDRAIQILTEMNEVLKDHRPDK